MITAYRIAQQIGLRHIAGHLRDTIIKPVRQVTLARYKAKVKRQK
jgi:hypothetical protein